MSEADTDEGFPGRAAGAEEEAAWERLPAAASAAGPGVVQPQEEEAGWQP
jgi:hypothetical protein